MIEAIASEPGPADEAVRRARAMQAIKSLRYGPTGQDYIWINASIRA